MMPLPNHVEFSLYMLQKGPEFHVHLAVRVSFKCTLFGVALFSLGRVYLMSTNQSLLKRCLYVRCMNAVLSHRAITECGIECAKVYTRMCPIDVVQRPAVALETDLHFVP